MNVVIFNQPTLPSDSRMPSLEIELSELLEPELQALLTAAELPTLQSEPKNAGLREWIVRNDQALTSLSKCALWLFAGELDASHAISQNLESAEGSFWHGIMHRREGDYWNAKYWFRRVGNHAVLQRLSDTDYGDSQSFVDRCERAITKGNSKEIQACEGLQWLEWQYLFFNELRSKKR